MILLGKMRASQLGENEVGRCCDDDDDDGSELSTRITIPEC